MIEVLRPVFLWAGGGLALVALGLHLLRPRLRTRRALPTARFLAEDPRSRIRLHRRPDHPLLLALRGGFALALGAAFAGLIWVGPSEGHATLAVIDGGGAPDLDELRARATSVGADVQVRIVTPAPGEEVTLARLLGELRGLASGVTGVDSVDAVVFARPRSALWGPGLPELRDRIWPGRLGYERLGPEGDGLSPELLADPVASTGSDSPSDPSRVVGPAALHPPAALPEGVRERWIQAWDGLPSPVRTPGGDGDEGGGHDTGVVSIELAGTEGEAGGDADGPADSLWTWEDEPSPRPAREILLLDGRRLAGGGERVPGSPVPGSRVPLLWAGGLPAAAARSDQGVCRVVLALRPEAALLASEALPILLEAIARDGCGLGPRLSRDAVDRAVRTLLEDDPRPATISLADLREGPPSGRDLTPWFLTLAGLLLVLEWMRTRTLDRGTNRGGAPSEGPSTEPPESKP